VRFVHSQEWQVGQPVEIFTSLHTGSLRDLIPQHRCAEGLGPKPSFAVHLATQVLSALSYLHVGGIIHQDIKPDNIVYDRTKDDSQFTFCLTDIGLSAGLNTNSASSPGIGIPRYMAPEVYQGGSVTGKSDVWSFGVMMLELRGYFCDVEIVYHPEVWRARMSLLPNYKPQMSFERGGGPEVARGKSFDQIRWYGRLLSMVDNNMLVQHNDIAQLLVLDMD
jgi:serine/threonine protein kinase